MVESLRYHFALHGSKICSTLLYSKDCLTSKVFVSNGVSLVDSRLKKRSKSRITGLEMHLSNGLLGILSTKSLIRFEPCNAVCVEFDSLCEEGCAPASNEKELSHQELFEQSLLPFRSSECTEVYVHDGAANLGECGVYYLDERNEEVLSKRILKLSRSNKVRAALALYKSMMLTGLKPSSHACNSLLSCILRNGMLDDALEVFEFLKEGKMATPHTYSLILKAVARDRGSDAALDMFEELCKKGCASDTFDVIVYNTMISAFGKRNDWVQAEKFWRNLQKKSLIGTTVTYSILICLFVRCGKHELAHNAYSEMVQNGLTPGDDVLQAMIGGCMKEGDFDMAFSVFQSMLNGGLKPNAKSCNAVIKSLGKAGKPKLALKVFGLMKSLGHVPDAYTWNSILCALNQACHHRDALQCFEKIRKQQPHILNFQMYKTIMFSCQRLGLWEKAVQLLWEMEASGYSVSTSSYNLVIGACEAARKPKVALQVYNHMVHQKCSPDLFTLLSVMRSCICGSLWNEVDKILDSSAPNGSLYNAAIQGTCLAGRIDLATKVYTKMHHSGFKANFKTRALMLQNLPRDLRR